MRPSPKKKLRALARSAVEKRMWGKGSWQHLHSSKSLRVSREDGAEQTGERTSNSVARIVGKPGDHRAGAVAGNVIGERLGELTGQGRMIAPCAWLRRRCRRRFVITAPVGRRPHGIGLGFLLEPEAAELLLVFGATPLPAQQP